MTLTTLSKAICKEFKDYFPKLVICKPHGGPLDKEELTQITTQVPAIYVAVLGTEKGNPKGGGQTGTSVNLKAFVVTKDKPDLPKEEAALNIVEGLLERIPGSNWGCKEVESAKPAAAKNLYSDARKLEVALWSVSWSQTVCLGKDAFETELPHPTHLYVGQKPKIGNGHENDYTLLEKKS